MKQKIILAAMAMFSIAAYSQQIHRYVVEVEIVPDVKQYTAKRLPNGTWIKERVPQKKTVQYWEVLSKTPLTTQQCLDSINAGRARRTINPNIKINYQQQPNLTMDGDVPGSIWDYDPYDGEMHYEDPDLYELIAD